MVYCGSPSKACENCRLRRIKCDQVRPTCGQCTRSKRICLGYRNIRDVMFRDENERVAGKFKQPKDRVRDREPKQGPVSKPDDMSTPSSTSGTTNGSPPEQPEGSVVCIKAQQNLSPLDTFDKIPALTVSHPVETIAISFLLDDYLRSSHFCYLPSLYSNSYNHPSLGPVLKAVALSSLSLHSSQPDLQIQSREYHAKGVSRLKSALEQPSLAVSDEVLAAVLLLALYETLTLSTKATVESWETHTRGALALLTLRGNAQFATNAGQAMFRQASKMIMMFCLRCRIRMPDELRLLMLDPNVGFANPTQARGLFGASLFEDFVEMEADIGSGILSEPWDIIASADALLKRLDEVSRELPGAEQYFQLSSRATGPGPGPWSPYAAQVWSNVWMAQLALNETVGRQYHSLGLSTAVCQANAFLAAENIFIVVEQMFPGTPNALVSSTPDPAAGYFSIWPLFNAGSSWCVSTHFRGKVIAKLEHIGAALALPQACRAAETLAAGYLTENWMHIYHVF